MCGNMNGHIVINITVNLIGGFATTTTVIKITLIIVIIKIMIVTFA